ELRPIVTAAGGWFVAGKFEQFRQDVASDAVSQAMGALVRLRRAEPAAALAAQRRKLLDGLGTNAGLAALMAPEMASLLGVRAEEPSGDPLEVERKVLQVRM